MDVPRRMWSRNCRSTSFRKSWKVIGGGPELVMVGVGIGVAMPLCMYEFVPTCAKGYNSPLLCIYEGITYVYHLIYEGIMR
jgi:hypothetical protein